MLETEVKFFVQNLQSMAQRLEKLGAPLEQAEVLESNLRFDTPDRSLTRENRVLRLRRDTRVRLTYKGAGYAVGEVGARTEIEFEAGDFDAARAFLEALGYELSMAYEKFRSSYRLGEVEIVLDRTPLGDFVELEGPGEAEIRAAAKQLSLDWEARCIISYYALFEQVKAGLGLGFRDLTFANFEGVGGIAAVVGLRYAD